MTTFAEVFFGMIAAQAFRAFLLAVICVSRSRKSLVEYKVKFPDHAFDEPQGIAKTMLGFY